jgi:ribosomal protein L25 (general stress protein Ctc)
MSIQLSLDKREATGKQLKALRAAGQIPSVVYGGEMPIMTTSAYNETDKVLHEVGYHSPVELLAKFSLLSLKMSTSTRSAAVF